MTDEFNIVQYFEEQRQQTKIESDKSRKKLIKCGVQVSPGNYDDFGFQYDVFEHPSLVLGISEENIHPDYLFNPSFSWKALAHQYGGILCRQWRGAAIKLNIKPSKMLGVYKLVNANHCCVFDPDLDQINDYRNKLVEYLGVDCQDSFNSYSEALYPIDLSGIEKLTDDLSGINDIDDLIIEGPRYPLFKPWKLFIIGDNCD